MNTRKLPEHHPVLGQLTKSFDFSIQPGFPENQAIEDALETISNSSYNYIDKAREHFLSVEGKVFPSGDYCGVLYYSKKAAKVTEYIQAMKEVGAFFVGQRGLLILKSLYQKEIFDETMRDYVISLDQEIGPGKKTLAVLLMHSGELIYQLQPLEDTQNGGTSFSDRYLLCVFKKE